MSEYNSTPDQRIVPEEPEYMGDEEPSGSPEDTEVIEAELVPLPLPEPIQYRQATTAKSLAQVAPELFELSKMAPVDAREKLAAVKSSSWAFQLWVEDADADLNSTDDDETPLSGMRKAMPRKMAVCHAQPDMLSWLRASSFTGRILLEFNEMGSKKAPKEVWMYVPEKPINGARETNAQTSSSQQALSTGTALQQMMMQMQQQMAETIRMNSEFIRESRHETRELIITVLERTREDADAKMANDPARQLGLKLQQHAIDSAVQRISDVQQGEVGSIVRKITEVNEIKAQLAEVAAPESRSESDEDVRFILDIGKDWMREKILGPSAASKGREETMSKMLGELNKQGADILNNSN